MTLKNSLRLITASVLFFLFLLVSTGRANANAGPHGNFNGSTDSCAGCHRAHSGQSGDGFLFKAQDIEALCLSCHSGGSGSKLDVVNGKDTSSGANLLGGAFGGPTGLTSSGALVTSKHGTDGSWRTMWGSGGASGDCVLCHAADSTRIPVNPLTFQQIPMVNFRANPSSPTASMNSQVQLTCLSCHDVHGNNNYRILRYADKCLDPLSPWHDPIFGNNLPCAVTVTSNEPANNKNYSSPNYKSGMTDWCSTCHSNYRNTTDSKYLMFGGTTPMTFDAQDGNGDVMRYRHNANAALSTIGLTPADAAPLPVESDPALPGQEKMTCLTCHYAHGSTVLMTGAAAAVAPTHDSALLRMDDRQVCEKCHNK
jgi:predicted CXXCH cytochrome family protein